MNLNSKKNLSICIHIAQNIATSKKQYVQSPIVPWFFQKNSIIGEFFWLSFILDFSKTFWIPLKFFWENFYVVLVCCKSYIPANTTVCYMEPILRKNSATCVNFRNFIKILKYNRSISWKFICEVSRKIFKYELHPWSTYRLKTISGFGVPKK